MDILVTNGHVVDPHLGISRIMDIGIRDNRIVDLDGASGEWAGAALRIDATGQYVFPGLVDFHTHLFHGGSDLGIHPAFLAASGVTAAVDAGSAGSANFPLFHSAVATASPVRLKAFVNASGTGLVSMGAHPDYAPDALDAEAVRRIKDMYGDRVLGIKVMFSRKYLPREALRSLKAIFAMAEAVGLPVCIHTTDPACGVDSFIGLLRPGDVFAHCFHGQGSTILDDVGRVRAAVKAARARGVVFDAANGISHFCNRVARQALTEGFFPDVISTDAVRWTINASPKVRNLPSVMSKYLALGMPLESVVKAATATPARLMGMAGTIGTLKPGALADVAICSLTNRAVMFEDSFGDTLKGNKLLEPRMTILNGDIVYCDTAFAHA